MTKLAQPNTTNYIEATILKYFPGLDTNVGFELLVKALSKREVEARYQSEVWLPITDYPYSGEYEVSSAGRVRRGGKLLKQVNRSGYLGVSLSKNNERKSHTVHRLVARAFIPFENHKPCVNHIDGDKHNNTVSNLAWCTYAENEIHSINALDKTNAILTDEQILEIINRLDNGEKGSHIAHDYGVSKYTTSFIKLGKHKRANKLNSKRGSK